CVRDDRSAAVTLALSLPRLTVGDLLARLGLAMDRQTVLICGPKLRKQQLPREAPVGAVDPVLRVCRIVAPRASDICTRCNWCADICPVDLLPMMALEAAQFGDARAAERAGVRRCIACGLCDYVCPSRLPLMAAVQLGQAQLRAGVSGD
ncbi:MAG: 4Fe-4S dicluster domain-containing protein, partial [Phycisphaerae bacterium]|nr:4Fe-4S dicluster domain-containing protein [Phycisphaerae bacterium]